ncbi:9361_t:CDS:1 [Diversispora eburnea]|uniref:9361_t:CDS:1 n=1 Tax=Diversispora eburnea TaxID=1213867 RepID=A0A9N8WIV0_9GLOM|nr:9361_t:CDS:1 [Diversispora eburnea]
MSANEDEIVREIVEIHLNKGLKNVNFTSNAFIIYRLCYQKNCALQNPNLSRNYLSELASESWKNESNEIKDSYKRMAKKVKREFRKKVTSLCFIHSNLAGTNDETNPPVDLNPNTSRHNNQDSSMVQNSPNIGQTTSNFNPTNSNGFDMNQGISFDMIEDTYNYNYHPLNSPEIFNEGTPFYNGDVYYSVNMVYSPDYKEK